MRKKLYELAAQIAASVPDQVSRWSLTAWLSSEQFQNVAEETGWRMGAGVRREWADKPTWTTIRLQQDKQGKNLR